MIARWSVSLTDALAVIAVARRRAAQLELAVAVAVVDEGGRIVAVQAMDGVQPAGPDVAIAKARAAALFRRPTSSFEEVAVALGKPAVLLLPSAVPNALAVSGAVPIPAPHEGEVAGAVGISGGSGAQDVDIAHCAATALARIPSSNGATR